MILPILLVTLSHGAGLGEPIAAPEAAESVLRSYDLAAYGGYGVQYSNRQILFPGALALDQENDGGQSKWEFSPDSLQDIVANLMADELEYEGRWFTVTEDERLLLRAPEEVQQRVRAILNVFGEASRSTASLRVDILNLAQAEAATPLGVVNAAAVERILKLKCKGPIQSYVLPLRTCVESRIHNTRSTEFLADYDVEVAQKMVAFDPVIYHVKTGRRLAVTGSPAPDGCNLTLLYWCGSSDLGVVDEQFELTAHLSTDSGIQLMAGPELLQSVSVEQRSLGVNTMIPHGKALVLRTEFGSGADRETQLVVLRQEGELQPAISTYRVSDKIQIHLIRRDALAARFLQASGLALDFLQDQSSLKADYFNDTYWISCETAGGEEDDWMDIVRDTLPDMEFLHEEDWIIAYREGGSRAGDESTLTELIEALYPPSEVVQVALTLDGSGPNGMGVIACELPLRVGVESTVVLGDEHTTVNDFDIEVAEAASISDPITRIELDGAVFAVKPRRLADGRIQVHIRGTAQLLRGGSQLHARDQSFGPLQLPSYDRLLVNQTVTFDRPDGGTAVIGNRAADLGEGGLRLTVQVR